MRRSCDLRAKVSRVWRPLALAGALVLSACGGADDGGDGGSGAGSSATGGAGASGSTTGGAGSGGGPSGGSATGGAAGLGGSGTGASSTGGNSGGGSATGGTGTGAVGTGGAATTCEPITMDGWTPPPYVPARAVPGACSTTQIQRYYDECLMGTGCAPFEAGGADAACGACLAPTPLDAAGYGPILELSPRPFYRWESNVAGCIELVGEPVCAEKIFAAQACARESCTAACGVTSAAFDGCIAEARSGVCNDHERAAVCVSDPAHSAACFGSSFESLVLALGEVHCG